MYCGQADQLQEEVLCDSVFLQGFEVNSGTGSLEVHGGEGNDDEGLGLKTH